MELTPQLLETQQFPEKWRGYDQDAVDEFLERVGVAVAELQDRLRTTTERLRELEASGGAAPAPAPAPEPVLAPVARTSETEANQVARALILAQEAADRAVAEAEAKNATVSKADQRLFDLPTQLCFIFKAIDESEQTLALVRDAH